MLPAILLSSLLLFPLAAAAFSPSGAGLRAFVSRRPPSSVAPWSIRAGSDGASEAADIPRRTVLVTGGAGYIGSHTCVELLSAGYRVIALDDLSNSSPVALDRVRELAGIASDESRLAFRECDVCDGGGIDAVLSEFGGTVDACIHFAGLKAVGESVSDPLRYYSSNVGGTATLLASLRRHGVRNFVFSSSATVYGDVGPEDLPIDESAPLGATNPYGRTKLFVEELLRDCYASEPSFWNVLVLRYFNPIGAHPSGKIGEDPRGIPNNLMPYVAQVCVGRREKLSVFGGDYDTPDGTGVRDYIHVVDLARGHVDGLGALYAASEGGQDGTCEAVNLGTGVGVSVLDLVKGMGEATGRPVPYEIAGRRPGDVASLYADASRAEQLLGWKAERGLKEMCDDTWRWQSNNPMGYAVAEDEPDVISN